MDPAQVRRWIANFEAIAEADREALRRGGANPEWAIALSLSLIDAAERAGRGPAVPDASRDAADEVVRRTWQRLRVRLRR